MFKVFIEEKILRNIIQAESQRPNNTRSNLFKILKMSKNLYVAMDASDLAWIKQLEDDYGLVADTTRTDYIKSIPTKPETVLKNPSSLFILDIPVAEAKKIQVEYGVVCRSGVDVNVSILIDVNDEHTTDKNKPLGRRWDTVLDSVDTIVFDKDSIREFSNSLSSPRTNHDSYYYAVNGKWMEKCIAIRNRLIK